MSLRGSTMPRPIPVPLRQALFRLGQQGQRTGPIAAALGLPCSTIRQLLGRFRRDGRDGIVPDYHRPSAVAAMPPDVAPAALRVRREHPTWEGRPDPGASPSRDAGAGRPLGPHAPTLVRTGRPVTGPGGTPAAGRTRPVDPAPRDLEDVFKATYQNTHLR